MTDVSNVLLNSALPPQVRALLAANPPKATPEQSLMMLIAIIDRLAQRGPDAANGLTITKSLDERGATVRIDLP